MILTLRYDKIYTKMNALRPDVSSGRALGWWLRRQQLLALPARERGRDPKKQYPSHSEHRCVSKGKPSIPQLWADTISWSSICRGATLWGLEHSEAAIAKGIPPTVRSRIARYSYGIRMDMEFNSQIHSSHEGVYNESGKHVVKDQMFWLIEKVRLWNPK